MTDSPEMVEAVALRPQFCIEANPNGDCWRACLATITGIDARTMPNFMHLGTANGDESCALARDWLRPRGLTIFSHWADGRWPLDKVLREISAHNPGVAMILSGQAARVDDTHSVVALDGAIVHDPSGVGLAGPQPCLCGAPSCNFLHWSIEVVLPLSKG